VGHSTDSIEFRRSSPLDTAESAAGCHCSRLALTPVNFLRSSTHLMDATRVKGPPGTGKSQTMQTDVAAMQAGKSVLFLAEKPPRLTSYISG